MKTVAAIARVTRIQVARMEIQVHPRGFESRRAPNVPAFADETQRTRSSVIARIAEARGGEKRTEALWQQDISPDCTP